MAAAVTARSNRGGDVQQQPDPEIENRRLDVKIDKVLASTGGFGRYQIMVLASMTCFTIGVGSFMSNLSYLEKIPREYVCTYKGLSEPKICTPDTFCSDPSLVSYKPNFDLPDSFDNFISRLDMECHHPARIGLIGSVYFVGWLFTLIFVPRFSDLFGRQKFVMVGSSAALLSFLVIATTHTYWLLVGAVAILGATSTVRLQVFSNFLNESCEGVHYSKAVGACFGTSGFFLIFSALYMRYLSKNTTYELIYFSLVMISISTLISYFLKESPRYLIKTGQIERASEVFE